MAKSLKAGEIDGGQPTDQALRQMAGWYDMKVLNVRASSDDDIALATVLGSGVVVREIVDTTGEDGNILVKTVNNESAGYVTYPIKANSSTGLLPAISHIKKPGSVATVICKYQKINQ